MVNLEIAKVVVAPAVALFVALVGWILTNRYNESQSAISAQKNDAEIEIARINAAMRYLELNKELPIDSSQERRQAIAIAAPALPPDLAFRLAIAELPESTDALDSLMRRYGSGAFAYLASYLELPFAEIRRARDPIPAAGPFATQASGSESRAIELLKYLRRRGHSPTLFNYLNSNINSGKSPRSVRLLLYLDEYRSSLNDATGYVVQQAYQNVLVEEEFLAHLSNRSLSREAKQSLAFAYAVVFGNPHEHSSDVFIREAAKRFWDEVDVRHGVTPAEGTLQSYIYEHVFGSEHIVRADAVALASSSLRAAIERLNVRNLNFGNVRLILYSYTASPTAGGDPAYLVAPDVPDVMRAILAWADTAEKRKELSWELGSLSGLHMFLNMLPDRQVRRDYGADEEELRRNRCVSARNYAEDLIDWYAAYYESGWAIPKFLHEVTDQFPDLESRIHREKWGLGKSTAELSNSGCHGIPTNDHAPNKTINSDA